MTISLKDISVPAFILDRDGAIVGTNAAAERLAEDLPLEPALKDCGDGETPLITAGERTYLVHVGASFGPSGHRLALLTDVSDVARDRDGAERIAHARSEFLAKLSHEVRSAVASMIGFSEMLHEELSEANRELAGIITVSGRHLIDTLNAVMDLAKVEFGDEKVVVSDVDVAARIRERVAVLRGDAEQKGLELLVDIHVEASPSPGVGSASPSAPGELHARLNPTFVDRILHNLIDNAIKYTDSGRVEVGGERREGRIWIYVADTGRGIESAFIPRLFAPFEREQRYNDADGSGLGLAVTRYLVELMDGQIYACSTPGEGSTFTVTFPAS